MNGKKPTINLGRLNMFFFLFLFEFNEVYLFKHRYRVLSFVRLLFKERSFISINRVETNTMYDFISSCGGLLGLFMGASVISVVEMIYHFTLRLTCWTRLNRINRSQDQ